MSPCIMIIRMEEGPVLTWSVSGQQSISYTLRTHRKASAFQWTHFQYGVWFWIKAADRIFPTRLYVFTPIEGRPDGECSDGLEFLKNFWIWRSDTIIIWSFDWTVSTTSSASASIAGWICSKSLANVIHNFWSKVWKTPNKYLYLKCNFNTFLTLCWNTKK